MARAFVDTSGWYALMDRRELGLTEAITTDQHFRIAGFHILLGG